MCRRTESKLHVLDALDVTSLARPSAPPGPPAPNPPLLYDLQHLQFSATRTVKAWSNTLPAALSSPCCLCHYAAILLWCNWGFMRHLNRFSGFFFILCIGCSKLSETRGLTGAVSMYFFHNWIINGLDSDALQWWEKAFRQPSHLITRHICHPQPTCILGVSAPKQDFILFQEHKTKMHLFVCLMQQH